MDTLIKRAMARSDDRQLREIASIEKGRVSRSQFKHTSIYTKLIDKGFIDKEGKLTPAGENIKAKEELNDIINEKWLKATGLIDKEGFLTPAGQDSIGKKGLTEKEEENCVVAVHNKVVCGEDANDRIVRLRETAHFESKHGKKART